MDANKGIFSNPIEIRDPLLNSSDILARVEIQVNHRRSENKYPSTDELHTAWTRLLPNTATTHFNDDYIFQLLKELTAESYLQEIRFSSTVPVVGWLVVAIRRAWNWMSTRWYVLPLLKQQSRYNEQVVVSMYRLLQANKALQAQVDELQQRLSKLEHTGGNM